jgi:hypothetical protein
VLHSSLQAHAVESFDIQKQTALEEDEEPEPQPQPQPQPGVRTVTVLELAERLGLTEAGISVGH